MKQPPRLVLLLFCSFVQHALSQNNPVVAPASGSSEQTGGIANLKLAILEPRIKSRVPDLDFHSEVSGTQRNYIGFGERTLTGEKVTVWLTVGNRMLAQASWSTNFPGSVGRYDGSDFRPADVSGGDLMIQLLHLSIFTPDDLAALANSAIPEVRVGAAANISDEGLLANLAGDRVPAVRKAAAANIKDPALLAKLVSDMDAGVHKVAAARVTDPALLAKLATGNEDQGTRRSAAEKLTDQTVLAKVAIADKAWFVRIAAVKRLTDQTALARIAVEDAESLVRVAAVERLTDGAVLAKVAEQDKSPNVREAAVKKRASQR